MASFDAIDDRAAKNQSVDVRLVRLEALLTKIADKLFAAEKVQDAIRDIAEARAFGDSMCVSSTTSYPYSREDAIELYRVAEDTADEADTKQ